MSYTWNYLSFVCRFFMNSVGESSKGDLQYLASEEDTFMHVAILYKYTSLLCSADAPRSTEASQTSMCMESHQFTKCFKTLWVHLWRWWRPRTITTLNLCSALVTSLNFTVCNKNVKYSILYFFVKFAIVLNANVSNTILDGEVSNDELKPSKSPNLLWKAKVFHLHDTHD